MKSSVDNSEQFNKENIMSSKSQAEIDEQIKKLEAIRDKIKPTNYFGVSNLDKLDAQIKVLNEDMDSDEIWDEWPVEESHVEIRMSADEARSWIDGESEIEDLATNWPMKK